MKIAVFEKPDPRALERQVNGFTERLASEGHQVSVQFAVGQRPIPHPNGSPSGVYSPIFCACVTYLDAGASS